MMPEPAVARVPGGHEPESSRMRDYFDRRY
jgi:hypothetical protein